MKFMLGSTLWDKIVAIYFRIVGCSHPETVDVGDDDRGSELFCVRCQR